MASASGESGEKDDGGQDHAARIADFRYFPALDGLRAISITMVFFGHLSPDEDVAGAAFGVTLFFFISGFLITRLLLAEARRGGHIAIGEFYIRRFLRLGPALMTFIAVTGIIFYLIHKAVPWAELSAAVFYYTNYFKVHHPVFALPYSILWSIAVEEHYYLLFPLALSWFLRKGRLRSFTIALLLLAVIIFLWRLFLVAWVHVPTEYILRATDTRIDSILYGAILSLVLELPSGRVWLRFACHPLTVLLAGLLLLSTHIVDDPLLRQTARFSIQGIALMVLFTALLFDRRYRLLSVPLGWPVVLWLGKISYSLYLWHSACIRLTEAWLPHASKLETGLVSGTLALTAACASYYGIERRMGRFRRRFGSHLAR